MVAILRDKPVTIKNHSLMSYVTTKSEIMAKIGSALLTLADYKQPEAEHLPLFADFIISDYSHLCIEDVQLCMANGLKGLYAAKSGEHDNIIKFDSEVLFRWLQKYSEEKRIAAMNFNPAPSNQFPRQRDKNRPCKMPEHVREALKKSIGYEYQAPEPKPKKINWKERMPGLTDQEVQIFEYFDDLWNEQGCRLKAKSTDQVVEVEGGKLMTRGEFVIHAKKLIEQNNNH